MEMIRKNGVRTGNWNRNGPLYDNFLIFAISTTDYPTHIAMPRKVNCCGSHDIHKVKQCRLMISVLELLEITPNNFIIAAGFGIRYLNAAKH